MKLSIRPQVYTLPSYSLTGDLLGFLRCGLQYRYTRIGRLPPSHPVQLWFGEFIHGVLEEAYRRFKDLVQAGAPALPPWEASILDEIRTLIKARLAARNLAPWDPNLEALGDARADAAIQELGPYLFPLIHRAEVRLTGARLLPSIETHLQFREADRYEVVGVIDVVTHVELHSPLFRDNPIVRATLGALPSDPPEAFEVIIDYKGMRRPPTEERGAKTGLWTHYAWQLLTYAELRRRQPDALPVVAGVLLYVNELHPTATDLELLKREVKNGRTDVVPASGSDTANILAAWNPRRRDALPELPLDFRIERALRVVPVTTATIEGALSEFDEVVRRIETCRGREFHGAPTLQAWERNPSDESTCAVCDSRSYCPDFQTHHAKGRLEAMPRLPGVAVRK